VTHYTEYWLHNLNPFLIRFGEDFGIRYYGMAYVLGFVVAYLLLVHYHRKGKSPLNSDRISNAFIAIIIGVMVGGRLGHFFFYDLEALRENPLVLLRVWEGGMASHGGFIGVALAILWLSRQEKMPPLRLSDLLVTVAPAGLFFGRVANFINGELWGKVTDVAWAVRFPKSAPYLPAELIPPRHPSQLYQAALEGLLLFLYFQLRIWRTQGQLRTGQMTGEFLLGYAVVRIVGEIFREPDADLILGLSRGTFYSIFLALAGVGVIIYAQTRPPVAPAEREARIERKMARKKPS
jgi:phosphatidylglycerol---prolipoprotein diacylglyceryl transferase